MILPTLPMLQKGCLELVHPYRLLQQPKQNHSLNAVFHPLSVLLLQTSRLAHLECLYIVFHLPFPSTFQRLAVEASLYRPRNSNPLTIEALCPLPLLTLFLVTLLEKLERIHEPCDLSRLFASLAYPPPLDHLYLLTLHKFVNNGMAVPRHC